MPIQFTRFLYEKNDVKSSLICSMLEKNLDDTIFWINELYNFNKKECWETIWEMYFDFYGLFNSPAETFIRNQYYGGKVYSDEELMEMAETKEGNAEVGGIKELILVCRNMIEWTPDPTVFLIHQCFKSTYPITGFRGPIKSWIKEYPAKYVNLVRALDKMNYRNIAYYLKKLMDDVDDGCCEDGVGGEGGMDGEGGSEGSVNACGEDGSEGGVYEEIINVVSKYFKEQKNFTFKDGLYNHLHLIPYTDKQHIVLIIVIYLANYNTKLDLNVNYLSERKDEIEMMNLIDNFKGVKVSKVLLDKRIPLCNSIYPFSRLNTDEKLLQWSQHIGACLWWQNKL